MAVEGCGDERFGEEIEERREDLIKFCRKLTKDPDDADDLAQEVMVTAYSKRADFEPMDVGDPLRAWMFTIANNLFISGHRAKRVRPELVSIDDDEITIVLVASDDVMQRVFLEAVISFIRDDMPLIYSAPFLRFLCGHSYADISEELSLPMGTVSTRLKRARDLVAEWAADETEIKDEAA